MKGHGGFVIDPANVSDATSWNSDSLICTITFDMLSFINTPHQPQYQIFSAVHSRANRTLALPNSLRSTLHLNDVFNSYLAPHRLQLDLTDSLTHAFHLAKIRQLDVVYISAGLQEQWSNIRTSEVREMNRSRLFRGQIVSGIASTILLLSGTLVSSSWAVPATIFQDNSDVFELRFDWGGADVAAFMPAASINPDASLVFDAVSGDRDDRLFNWERISVRLESPTINQRLDLFGGRNLTLGETLIFQPEDFDQITGATDPLATAELLGFSEMTLTLTRDDAVLPPVSLGDTGWRGSLVFSSASSVPDGGASTLTLSALSVLTVLSAASATRKAVCAVG